MRRSIAVAFAAVSTVLVCSTEARAADPVTKLSFSIWQSPDHYMVKGIQRWASEITKRTNGKVEFVFHYGGTLTKGEQAYDGITKGISDAAGKAIGETGEKDPFGNVQLSGSGALGDLLATWIKKGLGEKLRVRSDTLGYLQRSFPGVASEVDAREARMVGEAAVEAAVAGEHGSGSIAIERTGSHSRRRLVGATYGGGGGHRRQDRDAETTDHRPSARHRSGRRSPTR